MLVKKDKLAAMFCGSAISSFVVSFALRVAGGFIGMWATWLAAMLYERCTNNGRGQTLQGHVDSTIQLFVVCVLGAFVGSWILPALLS